MPVNKGILDLPPTGRGVGGISRYQLCRARWPLPSPRTSVLPPRPAPTVSWWAKQPRRPTLRSALLSCSALLATGSVVSLLRRVVASVEGARMRAARPVRKRGLRWRPEPGYHRLLRAAPVAFHVAEHVGGRGGAQRAGERCTGRRRRGGARAARASTTPGAAGRGAGELQRGCRGARAPGASSGGAQVGVLGRPRINAHFGERRGRARRWSRRKGREGRCRPVEEEVF
jgi:hypothetical protein